MTQKTHFHHSHSRTGVPCHSAHARLGRHWERKSYRFGLAQEASDIASATDLVQRRYAWRGYGSGGFLEAMHPTSEVTLIATRTSQVHGTLTIRLDKNTPLLSETMYPEEIAYVRAKGGRLCEFGKLAFEKNVDTLDILGPLFHLAVMHSFGLNGCTHALIEVNPRHAAFYQRMFGFEVLGPVRICPRVSAPAVLLGLPLPEAALRAEAEGGIRVGRKSIYPYCFGRDEIPRYSTLVAMNDTSSHPVSDGTDVIYLERGGERVCGSTHTVPRRLPPYQSGWR